MNTYNKIVNQIKRPISSDDIIKALKGKIKITCYDDIENNIDDFFYPYNIVALLYSSEKKGIEIGHWVLLIRLDKDTVEFFDPYGNELDSSILLSLVDMPFLSHLFFKGGIKNIYFNNTVLQALERDLNTCGRHIILRALFRNIPLKNYIKILKNNKITELTDYFVYLLTSDF